MCGVEDPTLWIDQRGVIKAVVHNWKGGGLAASADRGKTWRWYGGNCSSAAGSGSLDWSRSTWPASFTYAAAAAVGGSAVAVTPHRRERPHVVLDGAKRVVALTNGVQTVGPDLTWTMANPVNPTSGLP